MATKVVCDNKEHTSEVPATYRIDSEYGGTDMCEQHTWGEIRRRLSSQASLVTNEVRVSVIKE